MKTNHVYENNVKIYIEKKKKSKFSEKKKSNCNGDKYFKNCASIGGEKRKINHM